MYVVVETNPATGDTQVLYPRGSMLQVHRSLASAERHRNWYLETVYVEDPDLGRRCVGIFRLNAVDVASREGSSHEKGEELVGAGRFERPTS